MDKKANASIPPRAPGVAVTANSWDEGQHQLHHVNRMHGLGPPDRFDLKKVLVLSKISRYDFEKLLNPHMSDDELHENLKARGTNVEGLRMRHNVHRFALVINRYYHTVRWSNFDPRDPKMRVSLQSTDATPCGCLLE
jgi:hypothetical protein